MAAEGHVTGAASVTCESQAGENTKANETYFCLLGLELRLYNQGINLGSCQQNRGRRGLRRWRDGPWLSCVVLSGSTSALNRRPRTFLPDDLGERVAGHSFSLRGADHPFMLGRSASLEPSVLEDGGPSWAAIRAASLSKLWNTCAPQAAPYPPTPAPCAVRTMHTC